jgi:hypothetical protein
MRHHTKGPWEAWAYSRKGTYKIKHGLISTGEAFANAALIAASPELLEAVMDAVTISKAGLVASQAHIDHWTKLVQRILDIKPESR